MRWKDTLRMQTVAATSTRRLNKRAIMRATHYLTPQRITRRSAPPILLFRPSTKALNLTVYTLTLHITRQHHTQHAVQHTPVHGAPAVKLHETGWAENSACMVVAGACSSGGRTHVRRQRRVIGAAEGGWMARASWECLG